MNEDATSVTLTVQQFNLIDMLLLTEWIRLEQRVQGFFVTSYFLTQTFTGRLQHPTLRVLALTEVPHVFHMWFPCGFVWKTCGTHGKTCASHVLSEIHMITHVLHMLASHVKHVERTCSTCGPHSPHVAGHVFHTFHMWTIRSTCGMRVFHMLYVWTTRYTCGGLCVSHVPHVDHTFHKWSTRTTCGD